MDARAAGVLRVPLLPDGAVGRPGLASPSPTARASAPCSTATACGPSRYYVTKDDLVIMASEVGVLDIPPDEVVEKGRLQPGRMFLVDTEQGRIIADEELKQQIAAAAALRAVAAASTSSTSPTCPPPTVGHRPGPRDRAAAASTPSATPPRTCASSSAPMATDGVEADRLDGQRHAARRALATAAAALQLLQAALRAGDQPAGRRHPRGDHHVDRTGPSAPRPTCSSPTPDAARQITLPSPDPHATRSWRSSATLDGGPASHGFRSVTLPILFTRRRGRDGPRDARSRTCRRAASEAIAEGYNHHHPVRPRPRRDGRADPGAARRRRGRTTT